MAVVGQLGLWLSTSETVFALQHVILLGGGHTHLTVLKSFGMKPMPGVQMTLVTRDINTPYRYALSIVSVSSTL